MAVYKGSLHGMFLTSNLNVKTLWCIYIKLLNKYKNISR